MILLGIAVGVFSFASMWVLGPGLEWEPRGETAEAPPPPTADKIHITGRLIDEEWNVPMPGAITLEWGFGPARFSSEGQVVGPDGVIDLYFDVPEARFTVSIWAGGRGGGPDWASQPMWEAEIALGELRLKTLNHPQLLHLISEEGGEITNYKVEVWRLEGDKPVGRTYLRNARPGRYLIRDSRVCPARYTEVEVGSTRVNVVLPFPSPPGSASINIAVTKEFESPMIPARVWLESIEPYGFSSSVAHLTFDGPGSKSFAELRPGTYRISYGCLVQRGVLSHDGALPVTLIVTDASNADVNFPAYTFGNITVHLTRNGAPATGVPVQFDYRANHWDREAKDLLSDGLGRVEIGAFPGEYLENTWGSVVLANSWREGVPVRAVRQDENVMKIELSPPATATLRVRCPRGVAPYSELSVRQRGSRAGINIKPIANEFVLEGLPLGQYSISMSVWNSYEYPSPTITLTRPGEHVISLYAGRGRVRGRAFIPKKAQHGALTWRVMVYSIDERRRWHEVWVGRDGSWQENLPSGQYVFARVDAGTPKAFAVIDVRMGQTRDVRWNPISEGNPWPDHLAPLPH
ncbi:MAG: hypothetical protein H6839_17820 [Planctomycetes bacterium]|nr:hypothetical protein [Planctomycetota bacterium]